MDFETELYELPEALISKVLKSSGKQVEKLNRIYKNQLKPLEKSMKGLRETDLIQSLDKGDCTDIVSENEGDYTDAVSAVDGGKIISKSRGINTLLAVAVGVEGINCKAGKDWKKQCDSWIKIISHDENSDRLCQGVMSVMELNVILDSPHDIKIMDGTHFTPLLSIDKLLNISKEKQSKEYTQYLDEFFEESNLSDLSDIVGQFLTDKTIIAMPKYSSSRDIIESDKWKHYFPKNITIGDKFFFSWHLKPGEYTKPLSIGQSETGDHFAFERVISDLSATMACHSAIRAGKSLKWDQMTALLKQMDEFPLSSFCPHGRPVFVEYPISKLEKDFGRVT